MTVAHGGEAILCVTDRCSIERVMTEHQTGENEAMHLKKTKQLTKKIQEHRVQENTTTKKMPPEYVNVSSGMIRNHWSSHFVQYGDATFNLCKENGKGNDYTPEKNDLIGWTRKNSRAGRVARAHFSRILRRSLPNDKVEFPILQFWRQREHTTINLSFSAAFTSKALLPVHLQGARSTVRGARKKQ